MGDAADTAALREACRAAPYNAPDLPRFTALRDRAAAWHTDLRRSAARYDGTAQRSYEALSRGARARISLDEWKTTVAGDICDVLEHRLDCVRDAIDRGGEPDVVRQIADHQINRVVTEVDIWAAELDWAAASVAVDVPAWSFGHMTGHWLWVWEDGDWRATHLFASEHEQLARELGRTEIAHPLDREAAPAVRYFWTLIDGQWHRADPAVTYADDE